MDGLIRIRRSACIAGAFVFVVGVTVGCSMMGLPGNAEVDAPTDIAPTEAAATVSASVVAVPAMPTGLEAVRSGEEDVLLTWQDAISNEDGFIVWRAFAQLEDPGTEVTRVGPDQTSTIDSGSECGQDYLYFVAAFNEGGNSTKACLRVIMPEDCTDLSAPLFTASCDSPPTETPTSTSTATLFIPTKTPTPTSTPTPTATATSTSTPIPTNTATATDAPTLTSTPAPVCGDGVCNGDETFLSCASDCFLILDLCGDGVCNNGETLLSCPSDCAILSP